VGSTAPRTRLAATSVQPQKRRLERHIIDTPHTVWEAFEASWETTLKDGIGLSTLEISLGLSLGPNIL
jgi:hypothetical protein